MGQEILEAACARLRGRKTRSIDVGLARFVAHDGSPATRTFINVVSFTNCAVCNGRYFGAGMQVAPTAQLDDGEFDVTIWTGFGLRDFIGKRRSLYDGSHVQLPGPGALRIKV
jgi:diacylglycerol kinase family enzyme